MIIQPASHFLPAKWQHMTWQQIDLTTVVRNGDTLWNNAPGASYAGTVRYNARAQQLEVVWEKAPDNQFSDYLSALDRAVALGHIFRMIEPWEEAHA